MYVFAIACLLMSSKCVDDVVNNFPVNLSYDKNFTINSTTASGSETATVDLNSESAYRDNKNKISAIEIAEIRLSSISVPDPSVICNYIVVEAKDQGATFSVTDTLKNIPLNGLKDRVFPGTAAQLNRLGQAIKSSTTPVEVFYKYKFNKSGKGTVLNSTFKFKLKLS